MADQTTLDVHLNSVLGIKEKALQGEQSSSTKAPEPEPSAPSLSVSSISSLLGTSSSSEKSTEDISLDQLGLDLKKYDDDKTGLLPSTGKSSSYDTIALEKMKRGEGVSASYATKGASDPSDMYSIAGDIDDLMETYSSSTHSIGDAHYDSIGNVGTRYDADPCCDRDSTYLN